MAELSIDQVLQIYAEAIEICNECGHNACSECGTMDIQNLCETIEAQQHEIKRLKGLIEQLHDTEIERLKTENRQLLEGNELTQLENKLLHEQAINMLHVAKKKSEQAEMIPSLCHRSETVNGRIVCQPCEICPTICPKYNAKC